MPNAHRYANVDALFLLQRGNGPRMAPNGVLKYPMVLHVVTWLAQLHGPVVQGKDRRSLQRLGGDGGRSAHSGSRNLPMHSIKNSNTNSI
jgi:hypothetical protein